MSAAAVRAIASPEIDAFSELWPTLSAAGESAHYVFQTAEMIELWRATIGAARRTQAMFVRIDVDDVPHMLIPLGIERRSGARVLTFLDGGVSDYNAPVLLAPNAPAPGAHAIWRAVSAALPSFDAAVLDKIPALVVGAPNPLYALTPKAAPPSGHFIPLEGAWEDYLALRLHRPKDSRRKRRRLAEAGALRFVVAQTQAEVERLLHALITQKSRRYIELNGHNGFDRPGYRTYFAEVTAQLHRSGVVHLSALEVGGEIMATHWGLVHNKRFYSQMLAYAAHPLARFSPARLLVEHLIEWSYANGLDSFDLGYGDMEWKNLVGAQRLALSHAALPASALGWTYLEARKLRDTLIASRRAQSEQAA